MKISKFFIPSFFVVLNAAVDLSTLTDKMKEFCGNIYSLLPPISMLLVVAAAVTFAAGQLASAETRARATSWATAMIVGALFGFVLVTLIPALILALYKNGTGNWTDYCKV
ncbi:MAG: hypothetical protein ACK4J0_03860 [Candidatus Anstonellaceae archaeon]